MTLTPMMKQYFQIKDNYKDCILFFRLGDFYEMFFKDAQIASKELELVLTGRDCGLEERAPMCGIPFHSSNNYIEKLVFKGYKVAICEQVEDASQAKGLVKRDVIKVITPGTYIYNNDGSEYKNTYVMSVYQEDDDLGIAFSDISTGEFKVTSFKNDRIILLDEISKVNPREIVLDVNFSGDIIKDILDRINVVITQKDYNLFDDNDSDMLSEFENLSSNEIDNISEKASNILLRYIYDTQKIGLSNISNIEYYDIVNFMSIDTNTRRNLELTESLREKSKMGSLLWVLDKTVTSMGGRRLRSWIEAPLISKNLIEDRLDSIDELYQNILFNEEIRDCLNNIYDIERIVGKISSKSANPKDLVSLKKSLDMLPSVKVLIKNSRSKLLNQWYNGLDVLSDINSLLSESILDDTSISLKDGNIINYGYNSEVDELREAKINGKEWIASLESKEREFTGIKSLKVGYNKVFGYYIEISRANYNLIPEGRYIRKQTLANAERFITQELKEMENKILGADEKLSKLEYELFTSIRDNVEEEISRLKNSARIIGNLDALTTLATVSIENNYCKPRINEESVIEIIEGRHPVVEKVIGRGEFISNNTTLNNSSNQMLLITGPNMAGKSTYMRQVALITLMAQIGCFVPASSANISICDKIFTRIGASDDLAGGKSTFMVEMWEVANILNGASEKSLVLLDEVGRGTSTYDGLSIAWAVIEYIMNKENMRCKTLFATHYHELTKLEGVIEGVRNYSVAVTEINDTITFLHKIVEGGADQSYGIEVAKLAGLPDEVIERAKDILVSLEENNKLKENNKEIRKLHLSTESEVVLLNESNEIKYDIKQSNSESQSDICQLDFSMIEKESFLNSIIEIDVMSLTPMSAMNKLYELVLRAKELK